MDKEMMILAGVAFFFVFTTYFCHGKALYWRSRAAKLEQDAAKAREHMKIKPGWTVVQLKIGDTVYHEGAMYIVTEDGYTVLYDPEVEGV